MSLFRSVYLTTWYPSCVGTTCSSARARARRRNIRPSVGRRSPVAVRRSRPRARAMGSGSRSPRPTDDRPTDRPTDGRRSTIDGRRGCRGRRRPHNATPRYATVRDGTSSIRDDATTRDDDARRRDATRTGAPRVVRATDVAKDQRRAGRASAPERARENRFSFR